MYKNGRTNIDAAGTTSTPSLTRRAILAVGSAVALGSLAGCAALDGLLDSASEQLIGTTAAAPATFYSGRQPSDESASSDSDRPRAFRTSQSEVRRVPATVQVDSRTIDLEGWSISGATKAQVYDRDNTPIIKGSTLGRAQGYNSSRSNKPRSEWWVGPDDDSDDDEDGDVLVEIHAVEIALLDHVTTAQETVAREDQAAAKDALDAFINATTKTLRPALDRCGSDVCETVRENSEGRVQGIQRARQGVDIGKWTTARQELAGVEEIVIGDIGRLDDELVERYPGRPRFSDIIEYLGDEPTIGERFTVSLPDATLPGDRGSLAEQLTPERVLSYFAASLEEGGRHTPFHNRYRPQFGIEYDDDGCIELDGSVSLHTDVACGNIISADLDTYTTENRAIAGYSGEEGAFVSGAPTSADTDGKCVFVAADGTLREAASGGDVQCWGQNRSADNGGVACWGQNRSTGDATVSETLVCPVTVTPEDSPTPLPGLFYVRRILHDDQIVFAGGWVLDDGALYEDSATILFEEGPTEIASLTLEDLDGDAYVDRLVEQFSRDRSQRGSTVTVGDIDAAAELGTVPKAQLMSKLDSLLSSGNDGDAGPSYASVTALDAPLVHLSDTTKPHAKFKAEIYVFKDV